MRRTTWSSCTRAASTVARGGRSSSGSALLPPRRRPRSAGAGEAGRRTPAAGVGGWRGTSCWAAPPRTPTGDPRPPGGGRRRPPRRRTRAPPPEKKDFYPIGTCKWPRRSQANEVRRPAALCNFP